MYCIYIWTVLFQNGQYLMWSIQCKIEPSILEQIQSPEQEDLQKGVQIDLNLRIKQYNIIVSYTTETLYQFENWWWIFFAVQSSCVIYVKMTWKVISSNILYYLYYFYIKLIHKAMFFFPFYLKLTFSISYFTIMIQFLNDALSYCFLYFHLMKMAHLYFVFRDIPESMALYIN